VYHAPPAGSTTAWGGTRSYGDDALTGWIERYRPTAVLSGHVHHAPFVPDGSWVDRVGDSWVFNMGQQIGPAPAHIVIDTEAGEAFWFSLEGNARLEMADGSATPGPIGALPDWLIPAGPPGA
jgi:Icc-related predicted phosphoesterase